MKRIPHPDQPSLFDGQACRICGFWKPFAGYARNRRGAFGVLTICKVCGCTRQKAHHEAHREQDNARKRDLYHADPETHRARQRAYHQAHKAEALAKHRAYWQANKERLIPAVRAWHRANKDRLRETNRRRRAREYGAEGSYSIAEWTALCACFGGICLACRRPVALTVDHIVPLIHGGSHWIQNVQPLCRPCNTSKHARHQTDYRDPQLLAAFLCSFEAT